MTRTPLLAELKQDVAYAIRMLRRAPAFTAVAVITLALGVGANSAIFSVVHGVLLKSLPFNDAENLYRVRTVYPDGTQYSLSAPDFASVRQDTKVFDRVEAYTTGSMTMLGLGEPQEVVTSSVSDGLFGMLGLPVREGRIFTIDDHRVGQGAVAVLDHGFWTRQFGGVSPLGRSITLAGRSYEIVGVLAKGARIPAVVDLYLPIEYGATFSATTATGRRGEFLGVIAHARPGASVESLNNELSAIGSALQTAFPNTNGGLTFSATSLRDLIVGDVRTPLFILLGAVGFVLLVACANVANLLLARGSARQEEMAVRGALGASRSRVFRQLVTESVVLSLAGGVIGLVLAYVGTRALVAAQPADIPRLDEVGVNPTVALFTFGLSIATGVLFGLFPAFQATGRALTQALREGGRGGSASRGGRRVRGGLVVAEIALAVVLLMGAGLLIRSFVGITRAAEGSTVDRAMTFRFTLQGEAYRQPDQIRNRINEFVAAVRGIPGVTAASATTILPLGTRGAMIGFGVEGAPPPPPNVNAEIGAASITPNYFDTIGVPMKRGRAFSDQDRQDSPGVGLLNEAAVARWFDGQDPIGRYVLANGRRVEVVGVVSDMLSNTVREPFGPMLFMPYSQRPSRGVRIVVRTAGDALAVAPAIRSAFKAIDPSVALGTFTSFTDLVDTAIARPRLYTTLLALFAGVALALAAIGVFGVMNYAVTQRMREISIRIALGASTGGVLRMIVGQALALAAGGAIIGVAGSLALGRVLQTQLFGVGLLDPLTLGGVIGVLTLSAGLAGFLPARRAARLDPAGPLRQG